MMPDFGGFATLDQCRYGWGWVKRAGSGGNNEGTTKQQKWVSIEWLWHAQISAMGQ